MNSNEVIATLMGLSREESFVLYYKLRGKEHIEIGKLMGFSPHTVQIHSSRIYDKFGLEGKTDWNKLKEYTYEIMMNVAKPVSWNDWRWPTVQIMSYQPNIKPTPGKRPLETEPEPTPPQPEPPASQPVPKFLESLEAKARQPRNQIIAFIVVILLVVVFCCWGSVNVWGNITDRATRTPAPTITNTSFPLRLHYTTVAPTKTEKPTVTPRLTQTKTRTPTITLTPTQTATPTITPTPFSPHDVMFEDDFNNDLKIKKKNRPIGWIVEIGEPLISQHQLTTYNEIWLTIGDPSWKNYKIEFETYRGAYDNNYIKVGVRTQDLRNMAVAMLHMNFGQWSIVKKGSWIEVPDSQHDPGLRNNNQVTIFVKDNQFSIYIGGTEVSTFIDDNYSHGYVALYLNKEFSIDNFKITALP